MRDQKKTIRISAILAVIGIVLNVLGVIMYERVGEAWISAAPIFIGLMIWPLSVMSVLFAWLEGWRKAKLLTGAGEIARWRLTAAEWAAFREQEKRFVAEGRPRNDLNLRDGPPVDADVIFAARSVIADEDYNDLTPGGFVDLRGVEWVPGNPSCLEFEQQWRKPGGASTDGLSIGMNHGWIRIPVAAGETRAAMQVLKHYKQTTKRGPSLAMMNPKLTLKICIGIIVVSLLAAVWGFSKTHNGGFWHLFAAVAGILVAGGAAILALIVREQVKMKGQGQ